MVLRDANKDGKPDERFTYAQGSPLNVAPHPRLPAAARAEAAVRQVARLSRRAWRGTESERGRTDPALVSHFRTDTSMSATPTAWHGTSTLKATAPGPAEKVRELSGGNHSSRNIIFSRDGRKLYVAVGSTDNIDERGGNERRAMILNTTRTVRPSAPMHPVCGILLDWPCGRTNTLWTAVNERDMLGDDTPPGIDLRERRRLLRLAALLLRREYRYAYRSAEPELVKRALIPDVTIPAHSAPLSIAFYTGTQFPQRYRNGLFVALHGSWNRSTTNGAKVIFVPFQGGKPGAIEDFLTGFVVDPTARRTASGAARRRHPLLRTAQCCSPMTAVTVSGECATPE